MKSMKKPIIKYGRKRKLSKLRIVSGVYMVGESWGPYMDVVHSPTGKRFWWLAASRLNVEVVRPDGTAGTPADVATGIPRRQRLPWNFKR